MGDKSEVMPLTHPYMAVRPVESTVIIIMLKIKKQLYEISCLSVKPYRQHKNNQIKNGLL